jgi:alanine dehydrogenase
LPSIVFPTGERFPERSFYRRAWRRGKLVPEILRRRATLVVMVVGVPREIKEEENRVALTPSGAGALVAHGHRVLVERGAGVGSSLPDTLYRDAGAVLVDVGRVWSESEMVLKVKEPLPQEYPLLRPELVLFTYLHLAANPELTRVLIERRVRALAYETLQLPDGSLPLLAPMSEVAGRLAIQVGAWCLQAQNGGRGVLLSGASGVRPAKVVILGAGIAGTNACQVAVGVGAHVSILDIDPAKLRYVHDILGGHVTTVMSNRANVEEEVTAADLVVGSVLIPGARAPRIVSRDLVGAMRPGAALVDIAIDQGGCAETSRPTTHAQPTYVELGVVHYAVANMPAAVPHTATYALTNATLSYALALADHGVAPALRRDAALRRAANVLDGHVTHPGVAEAVGLAATPPEQLV